MKIFYAFIFLKFPRRSKEVRRPHHLIIQVFDILVIFLHILVILEPISKI